jgi:hypothetical protein
LGSTGISVSVLRGHKNIVGISVGADTEIGENTDNRYSGKSTEIGTFTDIGKSTDFGSLFFSRIKVIGRMQIGAVGTHPWPTAFLPLTYMHDL